MERLQSQAKRLRTLHRKKESEEPDYFARFPFEQIWRVDWQARGYPFCGVYVISPDSLTPCKVGVSKNAMKRIIDLQIAHWRPIQVSEYRWCKSVADAVKVEKQTHVILREAGRELMGEWFDVRPKAALEAMEWAALTLNIELRSDFPDDEIKKYCEQLARDTSYNNSLWDQALRYGR